MLSKILKELREEKNITQNNLAKQLNVTARLIRYYESGERIPPTYTLLKIADYFDVSTDYLLGRIDTKKNIKSTVKKKPSNTVTVNKNKNLIDTAELSPESQKDLEKYIELLKIKDKIERNSENSDELANFD